MTELVAVVVLVFVIAIGCGVFVVVDIWHDRKARRDAIRETDLRMRRILDEANVDALRMLELLKRRRP